jgi:2-furoate---CoA ligase
MNLGEVLYRHMLRDPRAEAVVDGELRRDYAGWYAEIRAIAGGLQARGLKTGDHFVTILSNRYETATLYWACQMLGLVFTPFNWRASADEIAYVLKDADTVAVAFEAATRETTGAAIAIHGDAEPVSLPDALHVRHHGPAQRRAAFSQGGTARGQSLYRPALLSAR